MSTGTPCPQMGQWLARIEGLVSTSNGDSIVSGGLPLRALSSSKRRHLRQLGSSFWLVTDQGTRSSCDEPLTEMGTASGTRLFG